MSTSKTTNYGTIKSEKSSTSLDTNRDSIDSTRSTDALLKDKPKKESRPISLTSTAIMNGRFFVNLHHGGSTDRFKQLPT